MDHRYLDSDWRKPGRRVRYALPTLEYFNGMSKSLSFAPCIQSLAGNVRRRFAPCEALLYQSGPSSYLTSSGPQNNDSGAILIPLTYRLPNLFLLIRLFGVAQCFSSS